MVVDFFRLGNCPIMVSHKIVMISLSLSLFVLFCGRVQSGWSLMATAAVIIHNMTLLF